MRISPAGHAFASEVPGAPIPPGGSRDRATRGERTARLTVRLPTAIEFVVNLRSARAPRLAVPHGIPVRAEEVIH